MSGRGADAEGRVKIDGTDAIALIEELDRREREAIAGGDWVGLDEILKSQRSLWRDLIEMTDGDKETAPRPVEEALKALYHVRRRNHALIERSFADVRRRLASAHAGSGARSAYREASGRAA